MQLRVTITMTGSTPVVALEGSVDLSSLAVLRDHLLRAISDHPGEHIVVDLDAVDVLDDTGLGILLGAAGRARAGGGELVIVAGVERVRERFTLTGFDRAVRLSASLAEVLAQG